MGKRKRRRYFKPDLDGLLETPEPIGFAPAFVSEEEPVLA